VTRAVALVLAPVLVLAACSAPARRAVAPAAPPASAPAPNERLAEPVDDLPALEVLAGEGGIAIARMHEVARSADAAARPITIEPTRDVCLRAIVAARIEGVARFEDDGHVARGETTKLPKAKSGLVPPAGPACAKKGERLRLVVEQGPGETEAVVAHAVVWQSP
jgi:hypothetical protein